jgi:hypothetical protein
MKFEISNPCRCDHPEPIIKQVLNSQFVSCKQCGSPIPCELCETNNLAQIINVDYVVCFEHEGDAVNNVADRRW